MDIHTVLHCVIHASNLAQRWTNILRTDLDIEASCIHPLMAVAVILQNGYGFTWFTDLLNSAVQKLEVKANEHTDTCRHVGEQNPNDLGRIICQISLSRPIMPTK